VTTQNNTKQIERVLMKKKEKNKKATRTISSKRATKVKAHNK